MGVYLPITTNEDAVLTVFPKIGNLSNVKGP